MESEKNTERYLVKEVAKLAGEAYKFTSPGRRFVTDRLCVLPKGLIWFIEVKSEGQKPTPGQQREIQRLTKKGHYVTWVDTKAKVDSIINRMREQLNEGVKHGNR